MSLEIRRTAAASVVALAAIGPVSGCGGAKKQDAKATPTPVPGIITDGAAKTVPLNLTRDQVEARLKQKPVRVTQEHHAAQRVKLAKYKPAIRRRFEQRFGKGHNGIVN